MLVVVRLIYKYTHHSLWGRLRTIKSLPGNNDATRAHHDLLVVCPAPPEQSCYLVVTWLVQTSRTTILAAFQFQLLDFLDSRLCSIVNRMHNSSSLQFTTKLKKCRPSLFVSFLESGVVHVIASHPGWLARIMGCYSFCAALDSTDIMVAIVARAEAMPLIGERG